MLVALLVLSVAFTMACVMAEAFPPKPVTQEKKPTPVMVEMQEDNDFDDDPPTVVEVNRKVPHAVVTHHQIDVGWWRFVSPALHSTVLRASHFLTWMASF